MITRDEIQELGSNSYRIFDTPVELIAINVLIIQRLPYGTVMS